MSATSALAQVDWVEGPLPGRPVLAFNPASLITMRGIAPASNAGVVRFTDVTGESGLPEGGGPVTALAVGDYDGDCDLNLLVAGSQVHVYSVHGGFVADISDKVALPLPAGAIAATFADFDNDGWLDIYSADGWVYNDKGSEIEMEFLNNVVSKQDVYKTGLFFDPKLYFPKLHASRRLLQKKLGFRMILDVVPLDASIVRGSHGLAAISPQDAPILIGHGPNPCRNVPMTRVRDLLLAELELVE